MKKAVLLPVLGLVILLLTSCAPAGGNPPVPAETAPAAAPVTVDLDLSGMSGTVVYAQVYNLLSNPEEYMGKTIRIAGYYSVYEETYGKPYLYQTAMSYVVLKHLQDNVTVTE